MKNILILVDCSLSYFIEKESKKRNFYKVGLIKNVDMIPGDLNGLPDEFFIGGVF